MSMQFETPLDFERMRVERHARLVDQMQAQGVDVLLAAGQSAVGYATGAVAPAAEGGRAAHKRAVAVLTVDGAPPELYTPYPDGVPSALDREHVHGGLDLEWDDDARVLAESLPAGRLAVDDLTMPLRAALDDRDLVDASGVIGAAKVVKTARRGRVHPACAGDQRCRDRRRPTDVATWGQGDRAHRPLVAQPVRARCVVEHRRPDLAGDGPHRRRTPAVDHRRPRVPHADPASRFAEGDLVWVDNGVNYGGYQSDYGNTWIVGREPNAREREHYAGWRAVLDRSLGALRGGATSADLTAAAGEAFGRRPWLSHFYLAHGTGIESAEMPYVGTDLGAEFDAGFVLAPGMVLVFEPIIWEDGVGGFRAEEIVVVTDDGYEVLSHVDTSAWS